MRIRVALRPPGGDLVIRDVVDGHWAEPFGDADSVLGEGLWALPGLVDAHAHLATEILEYRPGDLTGAMERAGEALAAGVTLLLDKGWIDDTTVRLIQQMPADQRPEIEAAARIIANAQGYFPGFALEVSDAELEDAVRAQAAAGAGWVKLIGDWPRKGIGPLPNFDQKALATAVAAAGAAGSRVAIHTMAPEVPSMAVAAGVHSIEHGLFLEESDLEPLGSRQGMWVPTILRCEALLDQLGPESSGGRLITAGLRRLEKLLPLAVEAGVLVLAGTDLIGAPANIVAEAIRLQAYGLTPARVVDAISTSAFITIGRREFFAVGAPANAVLYGDDPTKDLTVLDHAVQVIRLGRLI